MNGCRVTQSLLEFVADHESLKKLALVDYKNCINTCEHGDDDVQAAMQKHGVAALLKNVQHFACHHSAFPFSAVSERQFRRRSQLTTGGKALAGCTAHSLELKDTAINAVPDAFAYSLRRLTVHWTLPESWTLGLLPRIVESFPQLEELTIQALTDHCSNPGTTDVGVWASRATSELSVG